MEREKTLPLNFLSNLKSIGLRSESSRRLKSLSGFEKRPKAGGPLGEAHLAELARADLLADIERQFTAIRETLGYRRKEMRTEIHEAGASIQTPDFEYEVTLALDPDDPSSVIWRRELSRLKEPELVRNAAFQAAFGGVFDTLFCVFRSPASLAEVIDDIEEREPAGLKLDYDSQCTWCELRLPGLSGSIRIERNGLTVGGAGERALSELAELLAQLQALVSGPGRAAPEALPGRGISGTGPASPQ